MLLPINFYFVLTQFDLERSRWKVKTYCFCSEWTKMKNVWFQNTDPLKETYLAGYGWRWCGASHLRNCPRSQTKTWVTGGQSGLRPTTPLGRAEGCPESIGQPYSDPSRRTRSECGCRGRWRYGGHLSAVGHSRAAVVLRTAGTHMRSLCLHTAPEAEETQSQWVDSLPTGYPDPTLSDPWGNPDTAQKANMH